MMYSVGSFKNVADVNKKLQKYKETLDLQSQLQQRQEEANKSVYKMGQSQPIQATQLPRYGSVEEELADENAQSQQMMATIQSIFKYPKDGKRAYDLYVDEGYLPADFNRLSGQFLDVVKNIKTMTPEFFMRNWERFYTQVQSFGDSLVNIGIMDDAQKNKERQILLRIFNQYIRPRYTPEIAEESRRAIQYVIDNPQEPTLEEEKEVMAETPAHKSIRDIISTYQNEQLDQEEKATSIDKNINEILTEVPQEILEPRLTTEEKRLGAPSPKFQMLVPVNLLKEVVKEQELNPINLSGKELRGNLKSIIQSKKAQNKVKEDYIPVVADYLGVDAKTYNKFGKKELTDLYRKLYDKSPPSALGRTDLFYLLTINIGDSLSSAFSQESEQRMEVIKRLREEELAMLREGRYTAERGAVFREGEEKMAAEEERIRARRPLPAREMGGRRLREEVIRGAEERGLIESKESEFTRPMTELFDGSFNPDYEPSRRGSFESWGRRGSTGSEYEGEPIEVKEPQTIGEMMDVSKAVRDYMLSSRFNDLVSSRTKTWRTKEQVLNNTEYKDKLIRLGNQLGLDTTKPLGDLYDDFIREANKRIGQLQGGTGMVVPSKKSVIHTKPRYIIGHGIDPMPTEKFITFGNYLINKPLLFNQNRLAVKYPSQAQVKDIPSQIISQELTDLLKYIIKHKKVDYKLYSSLSKKETQIFHTLINKAKLDQYLGFEGYTNDEEDKQMKRFELLRGEVLAGNNNREVLKELRELIMNFMATNKMRKSEGNQILYELNSII